MKSPFSRRLTAAAFVLAAVAWSCGNTGAGSAPAAVTVTTSFENMGLLVFKRIASLELVMDLCGGIITVQARKLKRWQEDVRRENNQPSWGEWFEWLGDQAERVKTPSQPAHVKHRNWRP